VAFNVEQRQKNHKKTVVLYEKNRDLAETIIRCPFSCSVEAKFRTGGACSSSAPRSRASGRNDGVEVVGGVKPSKQGPADAVDHDAAHARQGRIEVFQGLGHGVGFLAVWPLQKIRK